MGHAIALVERMRDMFESGDLGTMPELLGPDSVVRNPFATMRGPDEFTQFVKAFLAAFSDIRIKILDAVESGDTLAVELRVIGRHTGTFDLPSGRLPATGITMTFDEIGFIKVDGDRIASWHSYYDVMSCLSQLGVAIAPPAA